jgi:hypothetical protein
LQLGEKKPLDNESEMPTIATLRRDMIPFIQAAGDSLRTSTQAESNQDFVGRVNTLNGRPDKNNEVSGTAYLRVTDSNNDQITVRVELDTAQYKIALEAHGKGRYVMISGLLRRTGGVKNRRT